MTVLSIDLASRRYRDVGIVALSGSAVSADIQLHDAFELALSDPPEPAGFVEAILRFATAVDARLILLDGPQGWRAPESEVPNMRRCEQETRTPGKTGLPGTVLPRSWTRMVLFSIAVFDALDAAGWPRFTGSGQLGHDAVETFPTHAWRTVGLSPLPAKSKKPPLVSWQQTLDSVFQLRWSALPTHDQLQAAIAGVGGLQLLEKGAAGCDIRGVPPFKADMIWREGYILSPRAAV